jgi:hypothetical protein
MPKIAPGSRFASLSEFVGDTNEERRENEEILGDVHMENNNDGRGKHVALESRSQRVNHRRGNNGAGIKIGDVAENKKKDHNKATRGGEKEKTNMGVSVKKGGEVSADGERDLSNDIMMGFSNRAIGNNHGKGGFEGSNPATILSPTVEGEFGPKFVTMPNMPRPPNWSEESRSFPSSSSMQQPAELVREGEVFLDANETGSNSSYETDMDIVVETPGLGQ